MSQSKINEVLVNGALVGIDPTRVLSFKETLEFQNWLDRGCHRHERFKTENGSFFVLKTSTPTDVIYTKLD